MKEFIPPYPKRHIQPLSPLEIIKYARQDLLSIWEENAFSVQFSATKILNRQIYLANCPEVVKYVFVTNNSNYEKKSPMMRRALKPLLGNGLFISDGPTWQKHRSIETPLFGTEQVSKYADIMIETALERAQYWSKRETGNEIKLLPEMGQLTAEIICRSLFGNNLGIEQAAQVVQSFAEYQEAIEQMDIKAFFGLPEWIPSFHGKKAKKAANTIHRIVDDVIASAMKNKHDDTLMGQFLKRLQAKNQDEALSTVDIRNELIVLFMAGHETTANTLAWAWYLISQCPDVESRLHQEVDRVIGDERPGYEMFGKLVYTQAIIEETLRLYPPVPLLSREAIGEDVIRGKTIKPGAIMLVVPWLLHRHKLYWEKPDHFIPERFLPDAAVKPEKFAYVPFSIGPRVCVAKFFGMVEATLCLAILANKFKLKVLPDYQVSHECRLTLRPKDNLPMEIYPR